MGSKRIASVKKAAHDRRRQIKKRYGLTVAQYDDLLREQGGVCAICRGVNANGRRLSVDHHHKTKQVRGLLCSHCNLILGHAQDDITLLEQAKLYLRLHEAAGAFK